MKDPKPSQRPDSARTAKPSASDEPADAPGTERKKSDNPLSKLRFGSSGSGGAEREPGPEKP